MARPALPGFDGPRPQYFSIVLGPALTPLGQVRSIGVADSIESTTAGRVGSSTKKTLKKTKSPTFEIEMWPDSDLAEVAVALNQSAPAAGGTIKLDPSASPTNLFIQNYDSEESNATLLSTIYLVQATALELSDLTFDEDGEPTVSVSGNLEELYWKRAG